MGLLGTGTTGGKLMMLNCKAGLSVDPVGEALFIAFANGGSQEVWNIFWEATYGAAKSSTWSYATEHNYGTGFAAHTTSGSPQMIVSFGGDVLQGITGCLKATSIDQNDDSSILSISDFANCKAFDVGTVIERPAQARVNDWGDGRIKYGCKYYLRPYTGGVFSGIHGSVSEALRTYFVNCYVEKDLQDVPSGSLITDFKGADGSVKAIELIHTWFNHLNCAGHDAASGINYDLWTDGSTLPNAGTSHTSKMVNSMYTSDDATAYCPLALTNQATKLINNAVRNIDQGAAGKEVGYDLATGTVTLTTQPVLGTQHSQLLAVGSTTIRLSHDINGRARTLATVDIGPEDFSSFGFGVPAGSVSIGVGTGF
jgi:hypothetical protein